MSDRLSDLEAKVSALASALGRLDERLSALEKGAVGSKALSLAQDLPVPPEEEGSLFPDATEIARALSFGGRTFLVLAGAFVLRAITDAEMIPAWLGVGLGLAFGCSWLVMSDRAGQKGLVWSAVSHGFAAVIIGFPLVFEATTRFHLFSAAAASLALALLSAVALGVAARRGLHALGWVVELAGLLTAAALMVATGQLAPPTLYLIGLGTATLWLGDRRSFASLRWPVALFADLAVLILTFRGVGERPAEGPAVALLVESFLVALYLGSIVARTLLVARRIGAFELLETAAVMLVGVGGAVFVGLRTGVGGPATGLACLACGVLVYGVALLWVEPSERTRESFQLYASLAIGFALAGTGLLLSGTALVLCWVALAVALAARARLGRRAAPAVHAVVFALSAALASGLLARGLERVTARAEAMLTPYRPGSMLVLAALLAVLWLTAGAAVRSRPLERLPQALFLAVLFVAVVGAAMSALFPLLAGMESSGAAGRIAVARTAVLVGGVLVLAWLGRSGAFHEARWLTYPVLAAIGLKILLEDLRQGRPATLVLTFALFGTALIVVPRMRRRPAAGEGAKG